MSTGIAITCIALFVTMQGCKIVQTAGSGGFIASRSGHHDCAQGQVCVVEVPAGEAFSETFTAVPRYRYVFAGWGDSQHVLCAAKVNPCVVNIPAELSRYDGEVYLTAQFFHQPELLYAGTLGAEPGIWETDVNYSSISPAFADDFDGDGDDDVMMVAAGSLDPGFEVDREGVILINNGDWTFTVADGARPSTTGARRIRMADFNADGRNDFFIADHGYDASPFPGSDNQLLLWTSEGFVDASDRLPDDSSGFTHSAGVGDVDGDGDVDILVGNAFGEFADGSPYLLLNDGEANFEVNQANLPDRIAGSRSSRDGTWAMGIADIDSDGHQDLVLAVDRPTGESLVYWGAEGGAYTDDRMTLLPGPEFLPSIGGNYLAVSVTIADINEDGRLDVLMGGYNGPPGWNRGLQVLINAGDRRFTDETERRLHTSAWSPVESWHPVYRLLDFNGDGTLDIVPESYSTATSNVVAWLNDGTGHYVALKSTMFTNSNAINLFPHGVKVRVGSQFKAVNLFGDGTMLRANAGVVVNGAVITLAD